MKNDLTRIFVTLVSSILVLTLFSGTPKEAKGEEILTIGFASRSLGCAWWQAFTQAGEEWGKNRDDVELITRVAEDNVVTQSKIIDSFIERGVDGIILQCVDSAGVVPAVDRAIKAGIPVATVDVDANHPDIAFFVAFGNEKIAKQAGEVMVEKLIEKNGVPKGTILELDTVLGMEVTTLRAKGFKKVMDQYENINVIRKPAQSHEGKALQMARDFLQAREIDGIYGLGQPLTIGGFKALKSLGLAKKIGEKGHIIIVGIDGGPRLNKLVKEGWIDVVLDQPTTDYVPLTGDLLVEYIRKGSGVIPSEGEIIEEEGAMWSPAVIRTSFGHPYVQTAGFLITPETADNPKLWGNIMAEEQE